MLVGSMGERGSPSIVACSKALVNKAHHFFVAASPMAFTVSRVPGAIKHTGLRERASYWGNEAVMLQHFNEDAVVLQGGKPVGSVRMERLEHEPKLCPCSLEGF